MLEQDEQLPIAVAVSAAAAVPAWGAAAAWHGRTGPEP
jgi:hypothetical protein